MKSLTTIIFTFFFIVIGCNRKNQTADPAGYEEQAHPEPVAVDKPTEPSLSIPHRGWQERTVAYKNVGLKHPTLYLEGPFEKKGSNDGCFKTWDGDSAISFGVSPVIFVGKVIIWPIRMVQTPPWKMQISRSDYPAAEPAHAVRSEPSGQASKQ